MADGGAVSNTGSLMSVVVDHGVGKSRCGYCKSPAQRSVSHGLWAFDLTVDDYQELLDRGWRRSGCYLYKPDMENTCCPSYTIRLKAIDFVPSKEQARVFRKMRRFLDGEVESERMKSTHVKRNFESIKSVTSRSYKSSSGMDASVSQARAEDLHEEDICINYLSDVIKDAINICTWNQEIPSSVQLPKAIVKKVKTQLKKKLLDDSKELLYASGVSFQIAAFLKRPNIKLAASARQDGCSQILSPDMIAESLAFMINKSGKLSDFSVKACNGHLNFYSSSRKLDFVDGLATNGGHGHHSKAKGDIKMDQKHHKKPIETSGDHRLEVRTNRSSFDPEEYALYRKYQIMVHKDKPEKISEESYKRFLVDTPLKAQSVQSSCSKVPSCGFGSFHQQYLIDGKLMAVGVVDILPRCLSSKYLFWDPDYAFLSPGKYSALKEIHWVKEAEVSCPSLQYYYLGYYIHSCSKMRYKASYSPSELLCPLRYQWVPYHIAKPLLDEKPYVVLSDFVTTRSIEPSLEHHQNSTVKLPHSDSDGEDSIEYCSDDNEEMEFDSEFNHSNKLDSETASASTSLNENDIVDVSEVVLDVNGSYLRFEDLQRIFGPIREETLTVLKSQLRKFVSVVGDKLGGRIVYQL